MVEMYTVICRNANIESKRKNEMYKIKNAIVLSKIMFLRISDKEKKVRYILHWRKTYKKIFY